MEKDSLSLVWWNTSLSPPTTTATTNKFTLSKDERILLCSQIIKTWLDSNYDFICLGEVAASDVDYLVNSLNIIESDYTFVSGTEIVGKLVFDTCILVKKGYEYSLELNRAKNLIFNSADSNVKVGQRFEFYLPNIREILVLYLSHWPSQQRTKDSTYNSIAQDLRAEVNKDLELRHNVILLGDYNVEPHHPSMITGLQASREKELVKYRRNLFYNPFWKFLAASQYEEEGCHGTYHLRKAGLFNSWHMIDQILISKKLLNKKWKFKDEFVQIVDINAGLNDPISDHLAVSVFIERA